MYIHSCLGFHFGGFIFRVLLSSKHPPRQIDTIGTVISETRRDGIENGLCAVNVLYNICMYCTSVLFTCSVQCLHVLYKCAVYMYRMIRALLRAVHR